MFGSRTVVEDRTPVAQPADRGEVDEVSQATGAPAVRGPIDLRDLPEFFGKKSGPPPGYGMFDIEILAEVNHAAKK